MHFLRGVNVGGSGYPPDHRTQTTAIQKPMMTTDDDRDLVWVSAGDYTAH